jgi:adenylate cyclase
VAPADRLSGLAECLARQASAMPPIGDLHAAFCAALVGRGLPLWRSSLGLELLHPELSGSTFLWRDAAASEQQWARATVKTSEDYLNSPTRIVDETWRPFRRRLDAPAPDLPLLEELRLAGATDYLILPLSFVDRQRTANVSYATRRAGGFGPEELGDLETASALLSPYAERYVLRRVAIDLLDTYVGPRSGERIFEGRIERGHVETLEAAILLADLRGFTALVDHEPRERALVDLNQWLEAVIGAVEEQGGEVLKIMGDAVLAMYPVAGPRAEACRLALAAALGSGEAVDRLNLARGAAGRAPLGFGVALHFGELAYGNVGGRRRLDFTVIGPAVNHASRLQELTKRLGRPVLASASFAAELGAPLTSLGLHALRDVAEPQEVFAAS